MVECRGTILHKGGARCDAGDVAAGRGLSHLHMISRAHPRQPKWRLPPPRRTKAPTQVHSDPQPGPEEQTSQVQVLAVKPSCP
jgi:hypothetical protein